MAQPRRASKQSKQAGGTFLGVVLGLIVGLAIAVVVALFITRAPSPFVAKVPPPIAETNSPSRPFDPNRTLQSKTPDLPLTQAEQHTPPNTAPGQPANPSPANLLDTPQIVEVAPRTQSDANPAPSHVQTAPVITRVVPRIDNDIDALPKKAPAPKKAVETASNAGSGNAHYLLQVGAYTTAEDAEQQRARLAFQGFTSKVSQRNMNGVTYYRVQIGPLSKADDMLVLRQQLTEAKIDTAVIRVPKP